MARPWERVLVIVGAGHAKHLRDFALQEPAMELVEASEYLPKAPVVDLGKVP